MAAELRVEVHHPGDDRNDCTHSGVSLKDGSREATLYLPALPTTLSVVSNAKSLAEQDKVIVLAYDEPLGEAELTPVLGEANQVEIVVAPSEGATAGEGR